MDHAVNRAPLNHEMSTSSRGSILPAQRGTMIGKHEAEGVPGEPVGIEARNAFELPDSMYETEGCEATEHLTTYLEGL